MGWRLRSGGGVGRFESVAGEQRHIDIFEDLTRRYAENAVGGFDEVVALAAGVLPSERVGEGEAGGELFGFDQKTGAVGDPWIGRNQFSVLRVWQRLRMRAKRAIIVSQRARHIARLARILHCAKNACSG
jgi:hypothetical protein